MAIDPQRHGWNVSALERSTLDGILTILPTNVLLLTGYWPVMGNSVAILTRSGEAAVLVPEDEVELAKTSTAARLVQYSPGSLDRITTPSQEMAAPLSRLLTELRLTDKTLGVELHQTMQPSTYISSSRYRQQLLDLLRSLAPAATLSSSDSLLAALAAKKTSTELGIMELAARIAAAGFERTPSLLHPGATEPEVAAAVQSAFDISPLPAGIQRSYGAFYCMSGPNSALASAAYARTRRRTLAHGDLVMIHANTCADGYWTDITRTYTVGEPSERHRAMSTAIQQARQAALDTIRPGVRASEVDHAARHIMQEHGFGTAFRHSTGHGVGFAAANANGLPRIHPASPDILEENMTFNVEPAAYFDGYGGMRHCDVVAVTSTGSRVLTDF